MAKRARTQVKQEDEEDTAQVPQRCTPPSTRATRSTRAVKKESPEAPSEKKPALKTKIKKESKTLPLIPSTSSSSPQPSLEDLSPMKKRLKKDPSSASPSSTNVDDLQARKLKAYSLYANQSPFPAFPHPTPTETKLALRILTTLHGQRHRPTTLTAPLNSAGCGNSPSVLDALIRTILSQNTSDSNSTRAKLSMDKVYGRSDDWDAIVRGGKQKLEDAIRCGGLAVVKSKVIISILEQVHDKYGRYSLDHLHSASTEDAYKEMLSFSGVGPKTASCVLLFCLRRESFAVDTHVWRITGLLGWRPKNAGREATQAHLEVRVPDLEKYPLHVLLVTHGKRCAECRAGPAKKPGGGCELRRAFGRGKMDGDEGAVRNEEGVKLEGAGGGHD